MKGFHELLDQLTLGLDSQAITLREASQRMARYIQGQLACTQVSVWLLEQEQGVPVMRRLAAYEGASGSLLTEEPVYRNPGFAAYLSEITQHGVLHSDDTLADERLAGLRESYLVPNDLRSVLYATIGTNGSTTALLCCAQLGARRRRTPQDVRALKTYADAISLRRARRHRREAQAASLAQRILGSHGNINLPFVP